MCNDLPPELTGIFSLELIVSLAELVGYIEPYTYLCECCFDNMDDPYDRVWHNKLPFIETRNGDYLAFDLADAKEEKQVVYLSHDGAKGHGYVLGKTFSDFLKNYIAIGCCGPEVWQMLPFIKDKYSGIDATCENAKQYRRFIGISM
jgi:hypothetical protein